jgi:hypothetical protein
MPRSRRKNATLLFSMTIAEMEPSLAVEGAPTARVFEISVEKVFVPRLRTGQIVVMNRASEHIGPRGSGG